MMTTESKPSSATQPRKRPRKTSVAHQRRTSVPPTLTLGLQGFVYVDLHTPEGLSRLQQRFLEELRARDNDAADLLEQYYDANGELNSRAVSKVLVRVAPHVGRFVGRLFQIDSAVQRQAQAVLADAPLAEFRKVFAKRRLLKGNVIKADAGQAWQGGVEQAHRVAEVIVGALAPEVAGDEELAFARAAVQLHKAEVALRAAKGADSTSATRGSTSHQSGAPGSTASDDTGARTVAQLREALGKHSRGLHADPPPEDPYKLVVWSLLAAEASAAARLANPHDGIHGWASLFTPHKVDFATLVPLRRNDPQLPQAVEGPSDGRRERTEPFALTDNRANLREVAKQVDYCLYCHDRDKDSCSKGLRDKDGSLKKNPLGVALAGCPLDEKIGEMHVLRRSGDIIGALATVAVDNPMMPGTGHRICNDCMKGCIYQQQEPVNIPQIETRALTDVLDLPWGFEIYSLLTRWNPLNAKRPVAHAYNGKNVLVVGLGPAGYTLSHYLLNEGFGVVGVDGLKLEPLPREWIGSANEPPVPIYDYRELRQPLESRTLLGFGGVSEYGITVRWDKTFLAVMYLNLLRRRHFRAYGGIRFGGTFTVEEAWELGFDHVAIASGAGRPTQIPMKNNLIRGIRKASDFLMGLQLTGAYKRDSLANLQVRLPAVVVGGGLTAIDTATELMAYYVVQAERTLERYETLAVELGEETLRSRFDAEELFVIDEAKTHGLALRTERQRAAAEGREPELQKLLRQWGGVSIAYRRRLQDSPAYRLNHEEISKCLEEGVRFVELMSPVEAHPDGYGALEAISFEKMELRDGKLRGTGEHEKLQARTLFVAAGTHPNVSYESEYPGTFELDERGYLRNHRAVAAEDGSLRLEPTADGSGFLTSYRALRTTGGDATYANARFVSYYGDNHPKYAGNVVKAMASAKHGYGHVRALFAAELNALHPEDQGKRNAAWHAFKDFLDSEFLATVEDVKRLAPDIVEVVVRAPMAARKFEPGQFYRFQNYEAYAPRIDGIPLLMEGLALTGAWVDREKGLLSTIALEMGTSSRMCATLRKGEPVLLMGPTGAPTETPAGETVLLAGGGLGNAVLFSIARALRAHGSRVIYFAGYKRGESLFKQDEVEAATDQVIWSTDAGAAITPRRPQDAHFRGNIVQAMLAYERGELGERRVPLSEVDRVIAIGSDRMMAAVKAARHGVLAPYLKRCRKAIGSINSPMQCMMKAVCAQCLQRVVDPATGKASMIYTCFNQDQELDHVDFGHLAARLRQNSAQEKLANLWFERLLAKNSVARV